MTSRTAPAAILLAACFGLAACGSGPAAALPTASPMTASASTVPTSTLPTAAAWPQAFPIYPGSAPLSEQYVDQSATSQRVGQWTKKWTTTDTRDAVLAFFQSHIPSDWKITAVQLDPSGSGTIQLLWHDDPVLPSHVIYQPGSPASIEVLLKLRY